MTWIELAVRLALAAVFAVAAVAKLADLDRFRRSLEDFRLFGRTGRVAAVAVPCAELVTALLLLVPATASVGAACALVLLAAFSLLIVAALRRGEQPDCGCFGRVSSGPVGRTSLVRNGVLAALASLVAAAGPGASVADAEIPSAWLAIAVLAAAVAALALFGIELLRQNGRLLARIDALEKRGPAASVAERTGGLPIGSPAPAFSLRDLDGVPRSLEELLPGERQLALVFSDIDCAACGTLPALIERLRGGASDVAVVSRGSAIDNIARWGAAEVPVLVQEEREVVRAYEVLVVPSAVLVAPDGRIVSATAEGPAAIEQLLVGSAEAAEGLPWIEAAL